MGNTISVGLDLVLEEIYDIQGLRYEKSLGHGHIFKTIVCNRGKKGSLSNRYICKYFLSGELTEYESQISKYKAELKILKSIPNAITFDKFIQLEDCIILVRPFISSNLYDRLSTRPFLSFIEKKWIAFQLLTCLSQCHESKTTFFHNEHEIGKIYHGDLKTENILMTSWNWVLTADFASFKPTFLPEDNPSDFSTYFDASLRRTCYLAPERFFSPSSHKEYRAHGYELTEKMDIFSAGCVIAEIFLEGKPIFNLSQLLKYRQGDYDPSSELLKIEDNEVISMISHMIQHSPESRGNADFYLKEYKGKVFPLFFSEFAHEYLHSLNNIYNSNQSPDYKIEQFYSDFDKVKNAIGLDSNARVNESVLILSSFLFSCLLNVSLPSSFIMALEMIYTFSLYTDDFNRLDRFVPYVVHGLNHSNANVRAYSLKTLAAIMSSVRSISMTEADIFLEYLFPILNDIVMDQDVLVRHTYATNIHLLCATALRFLEKTCKVKLAFDDAENPGFDYRWNELCQCFQDHFKLLFCSEDVIVKLGIINYVYELCICFGRSKAHEMVLSHLTTYLNDRHPLLRCAFLKALVKIGPFIGSDALQKFFLPLIIQCIYDADEIVIEDAFNTLAKLIQVKALNDKRRIKDLLTMIPPFLGHPNSFIRKYAMDVIYHSWTLFADVERFCIISPLIQPYLTKQIFNVSVRALSFYSRPHLSRYTYNSAIFKVFNNANSINGLEMELEDNGVLESMKKIFLKIAHSKTSLVDFTLPFPGKDFGYLNLKTYFEYPANSSNKLFDVNASTVELNSSRETILRAVQESAVHGTVESIIDSLEEIQDIDQKILKDTNESSLLDSFDKLEDLSAVQKKRTFSLAHIDLGTTIVEQKATLQLHNWIPSGTLIANFNEHKAAITHLIVSPDSRFFITASVDGVIKLWDTSRIETKVSSRSRLSYTIFNCPITAMQVCENSYSFAVTSKMGHILILKYETTFIRLICRVDCSFISNTLKYHQFQLIKKRHLSNEDYVQVMYHFNNNQESILILATTRNRIIAWHLHTDKVVWIIREPLHHGIITSLMVSKLKNWMVVGTSRGVYSLYDLRFQLRLYSLGHPVNAPIKEIIPFGNDSSFIALADQAYFWNMKTKECFRLLALSNYDTAKKIEFKSIPGKWEALNANSDISHSFNSICNLSNTKLLTCGGDKKIRFFDISDSGRMQVLCGLQEGELLGRVTLIDSKENKHVKIIKEELVKGDEILETMVNGPGIDHTDEIVKIATLIYPYPMIVSVSRDGMIKVWK